MATWHQMRGGMLGLPGSGYVLVSDAPNVMQTRMSFGDNRDRAMDSLEKHRENQPGMSHSLYKDGNLIA